MVVLFFVLFFNINFYGNENFFNRKQYITNFYQIEDGLPQNTVNTIFQTKDGYLWIGTQAGIARFDGIEFKPFDKSVVSELKDDFIRTLMEDKEKILWIGTNGGGLYYFDGKKFFQANEKFNFKGRYVYSL